MSNRIFGLSVTAWSALLLAALLLTAGAGRPNLIETILNDRRVVIDDRIAGLPTLDGRQVLCTALTMYHEDRGGDRRARIAVGLVVRNRAQERRLRPCDVVLQPWQFEWTSFAVARLIPLDRGAWARAQEEAWLVIVEQIDDFTGGMDHFYNPRVVRPGWARRAVRSVTYGAHRFLRIDP